MMNVINVDADLTTYVAVSKVAKFRYDRYDMIKFRIHPKI